MGRTCCVPSCKSGSASEKRERSKLGLKPTTLFKVPKNTEQRLKWSDILEIELSSNSLVCEHHFKNEDVNRYYKTLLKDGTTHIIEMGTYTLVKDALPINNGELLSKILKRDENEENPYEIFDKFVGTPEDGPAVVSLLSQEEMLNILENHELQQHNSSPLLQSDKRLKRLKNQLQDIRRKYKRSLEECKQLKMKMKNLRTEIVSREKLILRRSRSKLPSIRQ